MLRQGLQENLLQAWAGQTQILDNQAAARGVEEEPVGCIFAVIVAVENAYGVFFVNGRAVQRQTRLFSPPGRVMQAVGELFPA